MQLTVSNLKSQKCQQLGCPVTPPSDTPITVCYYLCIRRCWPVTPIQPRLHIQHPAWAFAEAKADAAPPEAEAEDCTTELTVLLVELAIILQH
jgi:hypothetical protein